MHVNRCNTPAAAGGSFASPRGPSVAARAAPGRAPPAHQQAPGAAPRGAVVARAGWDFKRFAKTVLFFNDPVKMLTGLFSGSAAAPASSEVRARTEGVSPSVRGPHAPSCPRQARGCRRRLCAVATASPASASAPSHPAAPAGRLAPGAAAGLRAAPPSRRAAADLPQRAPAPHPPPPRLPTPAPCRPNPPPKGLVETLVRGPPAPAGAADAGIVMVTGAPGGGAGAGARGRPVAPPAEAEAPLPLIAPAARRLRCGRQAGRRAARVGPHPHCLASCYSVPGPRPAARHASPLPPCRPPRKAQPAASASAWCSSCWRAAAACARSCATWTRRGRCWCAGGAARAWGCTVRHTPHLRHACAMYTAHVRHVHALHMASRPCTPAWG
jgi:hypothetical protein